MPTAAGRRRLCLVVDMEGYSRLGNESQLSAQERIESVVRSACTRARVSIRATLRQDRGDGMLLVLPDVDEPKVIPELVLGLRQALHQANSGTDAPVRLRAALTQGVVHEGRTGYVGKAVVAACRIVDSAGLREELAGHDGGDLALAVADDLHGDVVDAGYAGLDAGAFRRIDVRTDKFEGKAWVHLPPRGPVPEPDRRKQILTGRIVAAAATGTAIGAVTIALGEELAELLEETTESIRPEPTSRSSGYRTPDLDDLLSHEEEDNGPEPHLGSGHEKDDDHPH